MARIGTRRPRWVAAAILAATMGPGACVNLGSETIRIQRGDYVDALARTNTEELLSNIVRAKYNEAPIFLKVKTITAQPSVAIGSGAEIGIGGDAPPPTALLTPVLTYQQSPTIFYEPVQGKAFANELLTPTGPRPVFLMLTNGFDFSTVADLMFLSIGELSNARSAPPEVRAQFNATIAAIETLLKQRQARLDLRAGQDEGGSGFTLELMPDAYETTEFALIRDAFNLGDPSPKRIGLVNRTRDDSDHPEILFATRSLLAILNDLSAHVQAPDAHRDWVWSSQDAVNASPPIRIQSGKQKPGNTNTAIRYRNHWFWIAADDIHSQNTLYLLRILFDIQAGTSGDEDGIQLVVPIQ